MFDSLNFGIQFDGFTNIRIHEDEGEIESVNLVSYYYGTLLELSVKNRQVELFDKWVLNLACSHESGIWIEDVKKPGPLKLIVDKMVMLDNKFRHSYALVECYENLNISINGKKMSICSNMARLEMKDYNGED